MQELDIQEMDTQELDTWDENALPGRHRAPASAARRTARRLALAALSVLVVTALGTVTADLVGLSDSVASSQGGPPPRVPQDREVEPRPGLTSDLTAVQDLTSPETAAVSAVPSPELPPPAPVDVSASAKPPATPSVVTVRKGDSCPAVGRTAVTDRGEVAVCTASPGKGPDKWRLA